MEVIFFILLILLLLLLLLPLMSIRLTASRKNSAPAKVLPPKLSMMKPTNCVFVLVGY